MISIFITMTKDYEKQEVKKIAIRTSLAVVTICLSLFFFGEYIFKIFGITLNAFRIGSGAILFLTAVQLVGGKEPSITVGETKSDISIVPLAFPLAVGPGTTGAIMVMGSDIHSFSEQIVGNIALCMAGFSLGILLYMSTYIEKLVGQAVLNILSKLTGLILAALSAQIIFTGIKNFLSLG